MQSKKVVTLPPIAIRRSASSRTPHSTPTTSPDVTPRLEEEKDLVTFP